MLQVSRTCLAAGCHGITVHPRPDERHIRRRDVYDLAKLDEGEFNIEGYPSADWLDTVCQVKPTQATLVPDDASQLTSDHGWDLKSGKYPWVTDVVQRLREQGIRVSLFLDPDVEQVDRAKETGVNRIELYTESYARAWGTDQRDPVYAAFRSAAAAGSRITAWSPAGASR